MKWRINWWYLDAVDGICRGHDIIEANEDFDVDEATDLLDREDAFCENPQAVNLFKLKNSSPEPMKWGVLSVRAIK